MLLQPILSSDTEGIKWVKLQSWLRLAVDNAGISYSMAYPLSDILSSDTEGVKWAKLGAWMQLLAQNISGGGGSGITQLTGDVTAGPGSGSEAATIPNGTVTLAKMANLAQDQFIGRTTASTGAPQTATITAAARTVLDDVTVAAMVDTLGAASSLGSGGLVRGTAPTLTSPILQLSAALAVDDTYAGTTISGRNAGATIAQWEAVYVGGSSTWLLADANAAGAAPARGLAVAAYVDTNPAIILTQGTVRNDAWNFTPNGPIYLSATPGALTQTAPSTSGDIVQQVGYAITADVAYFDFNSTYLTVE
jgi:hypothetical protein